MSNNNQTQKTPIKKSDPENGNERKKKGKIFEP